MFAMELNGRSIAETPCHSCHPPLAAAEAAGGTTPRRGLVERFIYSMCNDATGESAGQEALQAIRAGGEEAQAAVYAMLVGAEQSCGDPEAGSRAYSEAINAIADGGREDLGATQQ